VPPLVKEKKHMNRFRDYDDHDFAALICCLLAWAVAWFAPFFQ
jgi:hypothetical protein